jgi:hypothetical protein
MEADSTLTRATVLSERGSALEAPDRFVMITLIACIFFQRFAIPIPLGDAGEIPLATPIVLGAAVVDLLARRLVFSRLRVVIFCGLAAASLIPTALAAAFDLAPRQASVPSLVDTLLVTGFATLSFRAPMQEDRLYAFFANCFVIVALAGIAQFVAQFFGVLMFRFSGIVPDDWLLERGFATFQKFTYFSNLYRANGFFLLEPSFFGQLMAVAIMIEVLCRRRWLWLCLFVTAFLLSASGTGMLVLAAFALPMAFTSGPYRSRKLLAGISAIAVALLAVSVLLPEIPTHMLDRTGEFSEQNSSGNQRFVAAFAIIGYVFHLHPWAVLTGIGPGGGLRLDVPYKYSLDTVSKYIIEYGLLGFSLYFALIMSAGRTHRQRLLLLPLLVLLLFCAENEQFSPILFPILLLTTVSRLTGAGPRPETEDRLWPRLPSQNSALRRIHAGAA